MTMSRRGRAAIAACVVLLFGAGPPRSSARVRPQGLEVVGQWSPPFEEDGAAVPRCVAADDTIECKPGAHASAVTRDGRVLYLSRMEEQESMGTGAVLGPPPEPSHDQARVLDLRSGVPRWATPTPEGGGANPNVKPGHRSESDPLGMAGIPGRPGDGLVGSIWGEIGGPAHNPTSPPDDPQRNDQDMSCGDLTQLEDGRIMIAGGADWYHEPAVMARGQGDAPDVGLVELEGLPSARAFDPETNSFQELAPMRHGRWYPTLVGLPDGKVLAAGGVAKVVKSAQLGQVRRTETFDPTTNSWAENYTGPASENELPLYPRLDLAPNGKVFYGGLGQMWAPFGQALDEATMALQQFFDPETRKWEIIGPAPLGARGGAFQVMLPLVPPYEKADILAFGGTLGPPPGGVVATPFSTLTTIDEAGNVVNRMTGTMHHARWFASGVLLPDGTVAAVGGGHLDQVVVPGIEAGVRSAELYDPKTGQWTEMAAPASERAYHHSSLLLPDMRILFGGHSSAGRAAEGPGEAHQEDPSFEVFSPPYLFRGPRPTITGAPAGIRWDETFEIETPQADDIEEVVLLRLPSPQHVVDSDQRGVILHFSRTPDAHLSVLAPPSGVVAPAGFYYLVVNKRSPQGLIPSVARIVHVGETSDPSEAPQPFPDAAAPPIAASAPEGGPTPAPGSPDAVLGATTRSVSLPAAPLGILTTAGTIIGRRLLRARRSFGRRKMDLRP